MEKRAEMRTKHITAAVVLAAALMAASGSTVSAFAADAVSKDMKVSPFVIPGVKNGGGVNGGDLPKTREAKTAKGCSSFPPSVMLALPAAMFLKKSRKFRNSALYFEAQWHYDKATGIERLKKKKGR